MTFRHYKGKLYRLLYTSGFTNPKTVKTVRLWPSIKALNQDLCSRFAMLSNRCRALARVEKSFTYDLGPDVRHVLPYTKAPKPTYTEAQLAVRCRITRPSRGRLLSFHCMNLPTSKSRDGHIGIKDFRGHLIRAFEDVGFFYHSEVVIWKDPVIAMQRTKAIGLLHKQLKKDSCLSRQGIPDYLVTMRKPGDNDEPVTHANESFPVKLWQQYALPVWMDINPSDTLQARSAREEHDERHICPLQLEVIRRALKLWTNPAAHDCAVRHGWYESERTALEIHALIHSEISEATECVRNGERPHWHRTLGSMQPEGEAVELADALIRILDYASAQGWDMDAIVREKMAYNESRPHRHGGKTK